MSALAIKPTAHVVDVLGNVIGRDQPILRMEKALEMVSLLGREVFLDEDVVFFDPFCKAGELLLACAFQSCWTKSREASRLLDMEVVLKEIYESNRYFGLAPDERHHRLSTRTFLGNTNSHDEKYNHIIRDGHYLSEIDGKLDQQKFETEFNSMIEYIKQSSKKKKIIAIGNPPYQESDGGFGKSAKSIYDLFTTKLVESKDIFEFIVVIPARWFGGGKGLDQFRDTMIQSSNIKNLRYFKTSHEVFPTVDINGGVCFLHFAKDHNGSTNFTDGTHSEVLRFSDFDIIPDDPMAFGLIKKVQKKWTGQYVGDVAWASKPFGLRTNYFQINPSLESTSTQAVPCLSRGKLIKYANIKHITKNVDSIDTWKVGAAAVGGGSKGQRRSTIPLNQIFVVPKGTITTETYNIIDTFSKKEHAENMVEYLKTDFARYFLGLRKITQHIPKDRWNWVPYLDFGKKWTDVDLFSFFGFTKNEIEHIKSKVKEWSC